MLLGTRLTLALPSSPDTNPNHDPRPNPKPNPAPSRNRNPTPNQVHGWALVCEGRKDAGPDDPSAGYAGVQHVDFWSVVSSK